MNKEDKLLLMYEEFGRQNDYSHEVKCVSCSKVMIYCSDPVQDLDEIQFICKSCRSKLP